MRRWIKKSPNSGPYAAIQGGNQQHDRLVRIASIIKAIEALGLLHDSRNDAPRDKP